MMVSSTSCIIIPPYTPLLHLRPLVRALRPQPLSRCAMCMAPSTRRLGPAACARYSSPAIPGTAHLPHPTSHFHFIVPRRCPHVKDVCRNRSLHPRHDVVFLRNAEGTLLPSHPPPIRITNHIAPLKFNTSAVVVTARYLNHLSLLQILSIAHPRAPSGHAQIHSPSRPDITIPAGQDAADPLLLTRTG